MNEEFDVIWRKGDGEMPEKVKHVVNIAKEEKQLKSNILTVDTEKIIKHKAVKEITEPDKKSTICNTILRALPDWFGIEASIVDYVKVVRSMPVFAVFDDDKAIGFVALKVHNPYTSEISVMGVLQEYHRHGIGKRLVERCEKYCIDNKMEYLTVKTLDESRESDSYKKTRLFYQSMGFRPLEVFPLHWDEDNPCLFLAKHIHNH